MAIIMDNSQQTSLTLYAEGANGARAPAVSAMCSIRPGKSVTINVDVNDAAALETAGIEAARTAIGQYIAQELGKAAALGLPVPEAESGGETE